MTIATTSHVRSLRRSALALVCSMAVVAAACSDSGPGATAGDADAGTDVQTAERLVFALGAPIDTLDFPGFHAGASKAVLVNNVNEGLTQLAYDDEGDLIWEPLLAKSWEQVAPLQWRFHLRDDVSFQNGQRFTAADAAFTINKEIRPDAEAAIGTSNLDRAEVVDDHTLDIFTDEPDAFIDRALFRIGIQPEGWGVDNPDEAARTAVGTGPYRLTEYDQNRAVIERWPDYWGDNEHIIDEVEIRVIPEAGARLAAIQAGEVHGALGLSPDLLAAAPAHILTSGAQVEVMRIDTAAPPLDDVEVRRAMNMAIDREALISGIHGGFAEPANGQGIPPDAFGYNHSMSDYPYDPEAAREIILDAGAEGAELNIACTIELYGQIRGDACNFAAEMLNQVGLNVTVDILSFDDWVQQGLLAPQNGLTPPSLFHLQTGADTLHAGPQMLQWYMCDSGRNTFCDPGIEAAIQNAATLDDVDAQRTAWEEIQAMLFEKAPMVWLTAPQVGVATAEGVEATIFPLMTDGDFYWKHWSFGS